RRRRLWRGCGRRLLRGFCGRVISRNFRRGGRAATLKIWRRRRWRWCRTWSRRGRHEARRRDAAGPAGGTPARPGGRMIRFASPWLLLLALAVVLRLVLVIRDRRRHFGGFTFSSLSLVSSKGPRLAGIPFFLECVAALLL